MHEFQFSKTNTFQAVLLTDGRYSFVIFNYGDIAWTGIDPDSEFEETPAQVNNPKQDIGLSNKF